MVMKGVDDRGWVCGKKLTGGMAESQDVKL